MIYIAADPFMTMNRAIFIQGHVLYPSVDTETNISYHKYSVGIVKIVNVAIGAFVNGIFTGRC